LRASLFLIDKLPNIEYSSNEYMLIFYDGASVHMQYMLVSGMLVTGVYCVMSSLSNI